jgi:hypothetical protein
MTPGPWIPNSHMDYIRVRTLYLLPGDEDIEPIYSGTFENSARCPTIKTEATYMSSNVEACFMGRSDPDGDDSWDTDMEAEAESIPVVFNGVDEEDDDELGREVDNIKRISPRMHGTSSEMEMALALPKTCKSRARSSPPTGTQETRKCYFSRTISDGVRRLLRRA